MDESVVVSHMNELTGIIHEKNEWCDLSQAA